MQGCLGVIIKGSVQCSTVLGDYEGLCSMFHCLDDYEGLGEM